MYMHGPGPTCPLATTSTTTPAEIFEGMPPNHAAMAHLKFFCETLNIYNSSPFKGAQAVSFLDDFEVTIGLVDNGG